MADSKRTYVKLGLFASSVTLVILLALLVMGGLRFWKPVNRYTVVSTDTVSGVDVESTVTYRGVRIGTVAKIELDRVDLGRVHVELAIDRDVRLPVGCEAHFLVLGVTGQRAIDITGGRLADGILPPGSEIPRAPTTLDVVQARAGEITEDFGDLVTQASETVDSIDAIVEAVDPAWVAGVTQAVEADRIAAIVRNTESTTRTANEVSKKLERAVAGARTRGNRLAGDLDSSADQLATVLERSDAALRKLSATLDEAHRLLAENRKDVRSMVHDLRNAARNAQAMTAEVRDQPSLLVRRRRHRDRR